MFEVGQNVWDILHGEGTVLRADETYAYPVRVKFENGTEHTYTLDGKCGDEHALPSLYPYPVEIVKKVTKPSINWEHVHSKFNYLAEDFGGAAFLYEEKPFAADAGWGVPSCSSEIAEVNMFASYTPGTCDWKDSLVARPKDA